MALTQPTQPFRPALDKDGKGIDNDGERGSLGGSPVLEGEEMLLVLRCDADDATAF